MAGVSMVTPFPRSIVRAPLESAVAAAIPLVRSALCVSTFILGRCGLLLRVCAVVKKHILSLGYAATKTKKTTLFGSFFPRKL